MSLFGTEQSIEVVLEIFLDPVGLALASWPANHVHSALFVYLHEVFKLLVLVSDHLTT